MANSNHIAKSKSLKDSKDNQIFLHRYISGCTYWLSYYFKHYHIIILKIVIYVIDLFSPFAFIYIVLGIEKSMNKSVIMDLIPKWTN